MLQSRLSETHVHPVRKSGRVLAALGFALALLAGCATAPKARVSLEQLSAEQVARARHNLRIFNSAWDLVNRKHYDPKYQGIDWEGAAATYASRAAAAPDDGALYAVINDMVGLLHDSHTHALTRAQAEERRTRVRARTGFNMARIDSKWIVTEVVEGTPAAEAGVKRGWIVVARNGEPLGERIDFRFKEGEEVQWEFLDEHDKRIVLSPRAKKLSTAARQIERPLEGGFIYLRFDEFDGLDRRWLSGRLKAHRDAPGVVIDLRFNPGGDTFSLGTAVGEFFDHAVPCGTFITRGGMKGVQNSWQIGSARYRGQVVVLVDGGTGSAAEIFAAVLQDHGRATIIGRRTAGAVLASWFYRLPDGGELQLSRLDYIAPKGRRIEGKGVEPDIVVPRTLDDMRTGRDRDLEEAMRVLRGFSLLRKPRVMDGSEVPVIAGTMRGFGAVSNACFVV
ncbi:MAG: S41 family peptidase [Opitutaceae bacterium]|nr:S41 family peptidase [Opitutaceae bacterium]